MILYKYIYEVALDDYEKKLALKIDDKGFWYMGANGDYLRHAKILFKTKNLQRKAIDDYRYHDPTKKKDKCIEVLLGKHKGKFLAISTLRKLDKKCIINHKQTYAKVPKNVLIKAIKNVKSLSNKEKEKLIKIVNKLKKKMKIKSKRKNDTIFVSSLKDLENKIKSK